MRISLNLESNPTWGELIAFVDVARGHVLNTDTVQVDEDELSAPVDPSRAMSRPAVIPADAAAAFIEALEEIEKQEGDARGVLDDLEQLREALRASL